MHLIARQSVELRVDTDAAARELHAELSASFQARMVPMLDDVFTAACPPEVTIRVERLEIDVGVVPREALMDAIAMATREQLAALLRASADIDVIDPSGTDSPRRLSKEEIALERLAAFLEHGVTTWRDTGLTRDALETTLLGLIASAPAALRRLLERLPPSRVGPRIWTQVTVTARHRLLAWLGVPDPAELDRAIADWTAVLVGLDDIPNSPARAASSQDQIAAWLFQRIWLLVVAGRRVDAAADAVGQQGLSTLMHDASPDDLAPLLEVVLVTAERLLPRENPLLRVIADRAAQADLDRGFRALGWPLAMRPHATSRDEIGDAATAGDEATAGGAAGTHRTRARKSSKDPRAPGGPLAMRPVATSGHELGDVAGDEAGAGGAAGTHRTRARKSAKDPRAPGGLLAILPDATSGHEHGDEAGDEAGAGGAAQTDHKRVRPSVKHPRAPGGPLAMRPDATSRHETGDAAADEAAAGGAAGPHRTRPRPSSPRDEVEADSPKTTGARRMSPMTIGAERVEGVPAGGRNAMPASGTRVDADVADAARQRAISRLKEALRQEFSTRRAHATFATEPLWVAHAGAVIVWPFLPGLFDACGLTAAKRFLNEEARARAVLLTAHLANGLREWGEHDLLLEKTLCGYQHDQPIASTIEFRDDEQQQASELLGSVIGHWAALKSTSVDGLRRAFLCRPGTLTAIASGWKLEIPRAGHDVLLDRLPWGIGLVLLPWMEQPLHVEW